MPRLLTTTAFAAMVGALLIASFTTDARAETRAEGRNACAPRDTVVAFLKNKHGETPRARGLQAQTRLVETWANDETGSWTITVSMPTGMTCIVAAGSDFAPLEASLPGNPA